MPGADSGEARVLRLGNAREARHDAIDSAEQPDERRDRGDDREIGQAVFGVNEGPLTGSRLGGRRRLLLSNDWIKRQTSTSQTLPS